MTCDSGSNDIFPAKKTAAEVFSQEVGDVFLVAEKRTGIPASCKISQWDLQEFASQPQNDSVTIFGIGIRTYPQNFVYMNICLHYFFHDSRIHAFDSTLVCVIC